MMKFEQIFWDNDGVLVDTERYYLQANREALAQVNIALSDSLFAEVSLTEGKSLLDLALEQGIAKKTINQLKEWRNKRYAELLALEDMTLPGVRETLSTLHGKIRMAIVTSSLKNHFDIIHKRTALLPFFDFCLTREDYTNSKPNAEPYLLALHRSGREPRQAVVIEDSPRGLAAAKAAGLTCWVIPGQHTSGCDFREADKVLSCLEDLPELLL
jgi:HAD superfamily hydrolase (TIGR01509 family)